MAACRGLNLPHYYYGRWKKLLKSIDELDASNKAASKPAVIVGESRQFHHGRPGILQAVENDLTHALFELREQGLQVNTRTVRKEASRLSESFRNKTLLAKKAIVFRFLKRVGLTHRVSTHVAQKDHHETLQESQHFISMMRHKVAGMNPDDVLNMDQTPIPFSYHAHRTLEKKGTKTIHVRSSTTDTKRATLAAAVTGNGKLLTPMLIFKGKSDGRIATSEFRTYPADGIYACQPKAWMDEKMMHIWIDKVLIPWKQSRDPNIVPLLVLDSYRVHMMGTIVNRIQQLGIEVHHIPGGCTYLCQPVDVGVNRPIKKAMTEQWEDWMMEGGGVDAGVAKMPSRQLVAEWIIGTYKSISQETGRNAWMKKNFEWF
jgi:hypothetical protein